MQSPRRDDQNLTSSYLKMGTTSTSNPTETNQPTITEYNPSPQKLKDHKDGRSQRWQTTRMAEAGGGRVNIRRRIRCGRNHSARKKGGDQSYGGDGDLT